MTVATKPTKKARPAPKTETEAAPVSKHGTRANKSINFKLIYHNLLPLARSEKDKSQAIRKNLSAKHDGDPIPGPDGKYIGFSGDGRRDRIAGLDTELNNMLNSSFVDKERVKALETERAELKNEHAQEMAESSSIVRAENNWKELEERGTKFIRDAGHTRVVEVEVPEGDGDARSFDPLLVEDTKCIKAEEAVLLLPRVWEEQVTRLETALPEITKPGLRSVNLDRIVDPDATGLPKIQFTGEAFRDPVTGGVIEIPSSSELIAAMFPNEFRKFCLAKMKRYYERNGSEGITSDERKRKLVAIRQKRFNLHLKIVGEFRSCRAKGIPVVLPGNLNLFAYCGLKPVRDRDLWERERADHWAGD